MSHQSEAIIIAIRGGELLALHEAILGVWNTLQAVHAGVTGGEELDASIAAAVDLLPAEMRPPGWVKEKKFTRRRGERTRPVAPSAEFEELI